MRIVACRQNRYMFFMGYFNYILSNINLLSFGHFLFATITAESKTFYKCHSQIMEPQYQPNWNELLIEPLQVHLSAIL